MTRPLGRRPARRLARHDLQPQRLSTVADVADAVHHDLAQAFSGARAWGPSAQFDGQRVGRDHAVADGDAVEILR